MFKFFWIVFVPSICFGEQSVTLAWDPNPETDLAGYIVYYGSASRNYTNAVNVGLATTNTVNGLEDGATYYFAVTAYNTNGLESDFSEEVSYAGPLETPVISALSPLLTRSNVTLRGNVNVPGLTMFFELTKGQELTNELFVPATTTGLSNYALLILEATNWTYRLCGTNNAQKFVSPVIHFNNRPPSVPARIRFNIKLFQSAGVFGPWSEAMQASLVLPYPPAGEREKFFKSALAFSTELEE